MTSRPSASTWHKAQAHSESGMVATKDKLATEIGLQILEQGGNAVDAGVAACLAIGVVEPASSGIGGGGYMTYQVGDKGGVIGFPMKGPLGARPDMYKLTNEARVGSFGWPGVEGNHNIEGFQSIATPGAIAGLYEAHRRFGKLPFKEITNPARVIAKEGFIPNWFTLYQIGALSGMLFRYEELRRVFMPGDKMPIGDLTSPTLLRQPDLADVLDTIGREGPDAFYTGDIAHSICSDILAHGGILSREDLSSYEPFVWDKGLEFSYRGNTVRVPPYASAGITTAMTLKNMEGFNVSSVQHNSSDMLHWYISSARLAYADRFQYIADPNFADVPWNGLISDSYTAARKQSIGKYTTQVFNPGNPWKEEGRYPDTTLEASKPAADNGTTHLCVIDSSGNAVSITSTIMSGFGSGIIPKGTGVVMNNGMMWYDPVPNRINSIAPGKLPLNNMTPALVLNGEGVQLAVGASGGRRITNCVSQLIIKIMDYKMEPQQAIDSPRVDCSNPSTDVDGRLNSDVVKELRSLGHSINVLDDAIVQTGFAKFASPVAILHRDAQDFLGGVDTFHSAHAAGPK